MWRLVASEARCARCLATRPLTAYECQLVLMRDGVAAAIDAMGRALQRLSKALATVEPPSTHVALFTGRGFIEADDLGVHERDEEPPR